MYYSNRVIKTYQIMTLLQFVASNDVNGNPQRCWAEFDEMGRLKRAFDEGYSGRNAVAKELKPLTNSCYSIKVSQSTYRSILRHSRVIEESRQENFNVTLGSITALN